MGLFLREKSDGRSAPGYGLYLLGGLIVAAAVAFLHARAAGGRTAPPMLRRARASDVASITEPAAAIAPVKVNSTRRPSEYLLSNPADTAEGEAPAKPGGDPVAPDSFDAITATLAPAPGEGEPGNNRDGAYASLPPSFATEDPTKGQTHPDESLQGYRDRSADPGGAAGAEPAPPAAGSAYLVPRGTLIQAYLLTEVDTANPSAILQLAAARTLVFNHRSQLPFGTRFLGALSGPPMRDRLTVAVDTILYPNGLELPVRGSCVEAGDGGSDIRPGVGAYYLPPPVWAQAAPYISDVATGYLGLLESRAQPQVSLGAGSFSIQSSGAAMAQGPLYQASAQAIQAFTDARLKEIEQRYAAHYVIPAGTACWLQLGADLDLSPAHPGTARPNALSR